MRVDWSEGAAPTLSPRRRARWGLLLLKMRVSTEPGFLCESVAEIVGPKGAVVGIDISADLIARCNRRKTSARVSYEVGDATSLHQPNVSFDVVVCAQVAEYVADVERVFSEAFRVLKPNGRTVFVATDWHTILRYSDNARRMAAV